LTISISLSDQAAAAAAAACCSSFLPLEALLALVAALLLDDPAAAFSPPPPSSSWQMRLLMRPKQVRQTRFVPAGISARKIRQTENCVRNRVPIEQNLQIGFW
jgi:hypothetical protein